MLVFPLVSINLLVFNSSSYIVETLESVRHQTYPNIELIISDDCSTDNTVLICHEWLTKNRARFVKADLVVNPKNLGISANSNIAFGASSGQWIKPLAGDDILLDTCIEKNVQFALRHNAHFICSNMVYFGMERVSARNALEQYYFKAFCMCPEKERLKFIARNPTFLNTPSWFISKQLLKASGGLDEEFKILEDQHFVLKILASNYKIYSMNSVTVKYRIHDKSISRNSAFSRQLKNEKKVIYTKYRSKHLSFFNVVDLTHILDFYINNSIRNKYIKRGMQVVDPLYYRKLYAARQ